MKYLDVDIHQSVDVYERTQERYGPWRKECTNSFRSAKLTEKKGYRAHVAPEGLKPGDVVFVVWAEWSSGDSFGNDSCGSFEVIEVFTDAAKAFELKKLLETHGVTKDKYGYDCKPEDAMVEYKNQDDKQIKYYRPWCSYFESLNKIHIETTLVGI